MMVPLHYQCCKLLPVRIITINHTRYSSQLLTCWFRMYSYSQLILQTLFVLSNFMSRMIATRSPVTWLFTSWLCSSEYGIFPPVHSSHSIIPAARVTIHVTSQSNTIGLQLLNRNRGWFLSHSARQQHLPNDQTSDLVVNFGFCVMHSGAAHLIVTTVLDGLRGLVYKECE